MKLRNKFVSLGTALMASTPIIGVVSCATKIKVSHYPLLPTYTGQADQLIALNVLPDYYPLQLGATEPYDYLSPGLKKYMYDPSSTFAQNFEKKITSMMNRIPVKGTSWWNMQALAPGERGSDPSYWERQKGDVLLYEHYLLDDDEKVIDSNTAPRHYWETAVETNFRWSRDPFTRLSKGVIYGIDLIDVKDGVWKKGPNFDTANSVTINGDTVQITSSDKKILERFINENTIGNKGSWIYNSRYFAYLYHSMFLDNPEFMNSDFANWIMDSTVENPFDANDRNNEWIRRLFAASTYTDEEKQAGISSPYYLTKPVRHHPIYEQQDGQVGSAPMFEGAVRDNLLYLFNVAWQVDNLATYGTVYGKAEYDKGNQVNFDKVKNFIASKLRTDQVSGLKNAFDNANKISFDLRTRMANIKKYFNDLGALGKTFGILTIAPGHGMSTIQSMSKYSFIYKELGLAQPLPDNLDTLGKHAEQVAKTPNALFNMDDNGWWWNLGESNQIAANAHHFKKSFDMGVIVSRDINYESVIENDQITKQAITDIYKTNVDINSHRVDYDLWSEGIKTPFVMHMVLDQIIKSVETWYKQTHGSLIASSHKADALNWGNYFGNEFINN